MKKYILATIIGTVTLTSCLSFFPNRYEKALVYNGFPANMNTMIGTKVNIKGYYSLVTDSNISTSKGDYSVVDNGREHLQAIIPSSFMKMGLMEIFFSMPWGKIFQQMNIIRKSIWN